RREISVVPEGSADASSGDGRCTRATTSAPLYSSSGVRAMVAPACSYISSSKLARSPAPVSTVTATPTRARRATLSGTSATLVSPDRVSLGTATFTMIASSCSPPGGGRAPRIFRRYVVAGRGERTSPVGRFGSFEQLRKEVTHPP